MDPKRLIPVKTLAQARAMRAESSPAEIQLWSRLRNRKLNGFKFRRQQPIPPFIADFFCADAQLVIEVDGDSHGERERYDASRTLRIEQDGKLVLRFTNRDVAKHFDAVLEAILLECERRTGRLK